ncbi:hypothetical protein EST38_g12280 [Candolleomyces aberdarensis]|uniref:Uncharacterized protein n=1 Tax=Candolleomyces aberdarensis TaxID=2316362 RepID=A0A4Q2D2U1_9AGAR|nr:hypothetical protein EST38_g12280 [Candolleomyces aberdarensis]
MATHNDFRRYAKHCRNALDLSSQYYLTRSAPLTVCVYLVRKMKISPTLDFDERGSVEVLLSALEAHLERVEVLVVETNKEG